MARVRARLPTRARLRGRTMAGAETSWLGRLLGVPEVKAAFIKGIAVALGAVAVAVAIDRVG